MSRGKRRLEYLDDEVVIRTAGELVNASLSEYFSNFIYLVM